MRSRKKVSTVPITPWRASLHNLIFEAETKAGKTFDIILMILIALSVATVMLDSVAAVRSEYGELLHNLEWFFTIVFAIEYVLRLVATLRPWRYALSFFGLTDLLAILPGLISILFPGFQYLLVIRVFRIIRILRIFEFLDYLREWTMLLKALQASQARIMAFLFSILIAVTFLGALMYVVEGEEAGFTSIPRSIYWAIVTLSTVGYGDIAPQTGFGQFVAAIVMILSYSMLAVPTGIVTVQLSAMQRRQDQKLTRACHSCGQDGHDMDADFCKYCGESLELEVTGDPLKA